MSLLTALSPDAIVREPFPHLVVENAMDAEWCGKLTREFPPLASFVKGRELPENKKIVRRATDLLSDPGLSPAWHEVIHEHLRAEVFAEWLALLGTELMKQYPAFEDSHGDPALMRVGIRGSAEPFMHDVALDAALVAHTPVTGDARAERGPHVKEPNKPFLGFLFLRPQEDLGEGGGLELYAVREGNVVLAGRNEVDASRLRVVRRIPYRSNTLVLLLNTPHTITTHAARGCSAVPMQYFHFLAELPRPLFSLPRIT